MQKIMFNDRYGLTQAVIEGRKTMTRRLVPWDFTEQWMEFVSDAPSVGGVYVHESEKDFYEREAPRYTVGEIVAVAQNYSSFYNILDNTRPIPEGAGWDNKMFVRADLMPHRIRITGIKCERLQDISDEDCLLEGVMEHPYIGYVVDGIFYEGHKDYEYNEPMIIFQTPREAFASLIDRVSGKGTWASNPWVVVYEFELVK